MASSFEIFLLREQVRSENGTTSQLSFDTETQEADDALDRLLEPFGQNSWELLGNMNVTFQRQNFWPWAIIAFEREYQLPGHVFASRRNPQDVLLSAYSLKGKYSIAESGPPAVSMLWFKNKSVAADLATKSPLFSACWAVLNDKSEDKHWLCIPEPLPDDWVAEAEKTDAELFWKVYQTH